MAQNSEAVDAFKGTYKQSIELVCNAVSLYARVTGESKTIADVLLLEIARQIKMNPEGRASQFLDHFLFGGGEDIVFESGLLLNEDIGVRKRLSSEILHRVSSGPSGDERTISGGAFVVSIRQKDFAVQDWQFALGSFAFEWELVQLSSDKKRLFAKVWGANEYKWHPAADRVTQCIHKAADRLTGAKEVRAKNFWMVARPCTIVVASGKPLSGV